LGSTKTLPKQHLTVADDDADKTSTLIAVNAGVAGDYCKMLLTFDTSHIN